MRRVGDCEACYVAKPLLAICRNAQLVSHRGVLNLIFIHSLRAATAVANATLISIEV